MNISYEKSDIAELSLSELFLGFFEFYAQFDYNSNAVCVISGNVLSKNKRDRKYLEVKNPLEPKINVASNIHEKAVLKFRTSCQNTVIKFADLQVKFQNFSIF